MYFEDSKVTELSKFELSCIETLNEIKRNNFIDNVP